MQWVWKCAIIITNTPRISWVYNWKTAARTSLGNPKVISLSLSAMCVFSFFPLWRVAGTRSGVVTAKQFFRNANNRDALRCVKAKYLGPRCVRVLFYYIHSHQRSISRANWNMKKKKYIVEANDAILGTYNFKWVQVETAIELQFRNKLVVRRMKYWRAAFESKIEFRFELQKQASAGEQLFIHSFVCLAAMKHNTAHIKCRTSL